MYPEEINKTEVHSIITRYKTVMKLKDDKGVLNHYWLFATVHKGIVDEAESAYYGDEPDIEIYLQKEHLASNEDKESFLKEISNPKGIPSDVLSKYDEKFGLERVIDKELIDEIMEMVKIYNIDLTSVY